MALADTTEVPDALYNRYRPRRLSELVGQDHVTTPLRRAFDKNRIHHAYLLSGPRGCGKTSTARILAAGLVCEEGPTADPCNTCDQCTSVAKGNHIDVIELDAASNGGVEDARELRERAHFSPAIARYKVVVVDEAHMVTTAGFNALLKLIEEPPPHIRFIFATTNPEKVLATIRSRTYHYGFRLVPAPALAAHIETIVAKEAHTLEDGVLALILRAGGGSMRDSLAVLGQLLDGSENNTVRLTEAADLLGTTNDTVLDQALTALANRDTAALLSVIGDAIDAGAEPKRINEDLLDRLRDLLVLTTTGIPPLAAEVAGPTILASWKDLAQRITVRGLAIACETFQAATVSMTNGQPRIVLEVAAARALIAINDTVDVTAALNALSRQVANLDQTAPAPRPSLMPETYASTPQSPGAETPTDYRGPTPGITQNPGGMIMGVNHDVTPGGPHDNPLGTTPTPVAPATGPGAGAGASAGVDGSEAVAAWPRVLDAVAQHKRTTWMLLRNTTVTDISNGTITLQATPGFEQGFRNSGHDNILATAAAEVLGGTWTVEVQAA